MLQLDKVVQTVFETSVCIVWVPNGRLFSSTVIKTDPETIEVTLPKTSSEQILGRWLVVLSSGVVVVAAWLLSEGPCNEVVVPLSDILPVTITMEVGVGILSVHVSADEAVTTVFEKGTTAAMHWISL